MRTALILFAKHLMLFTVRFSVRCLLSFVQLVVVHVFAKPGQCTDALSLCVSACLCVYVFVSIQSAGRTGVERSATAAAAHVAAGNASAEEVKLIETLVCVYFSLCLFLVVHVFAKHG